MCIRDRGYRVGSIYLSAAEVEDEEWQGNYSIRLTSSTASVCHVITTNEWRGTNMAELDSWCITTAETMAIVDSTVYTEETAGRGKVLNIDCGPLFEIGIPGLMEQRGDSLFQESVHDFTRPTPYGTGEFAMAMEDETDMEIRLGPYIYPKIEAVADAINMETYMVGFGMLALAYLMLGIRGVPAGHAVAGFLLCSPILFVGLYTGTFSWMWFCLIGMIIAGLAAYHLLWRQA